MLFSKYLGAACVAAGVFGLLISILLIAKAFFTDALSSWGYGFYGLLVGGIGFGLIVAGQALYKPKN
jgi:hypothetical protein